MKFFKRFLGKETKPPDCCGVDIKEVENSQDESCCVTSASEDSCCK